MVLQGVDVRRKEHGWWVQLELCIITAEYNVYLFVTGNF